MRFLSLFIFVLTSTEITLTLPTDLLAKNNRQDIIPNIRFYCSHSSDQIYKETYINDEKLLQKLNLTSNFAFYVHGWHSEFNSDKKNSDEYQIGIEWIKSGNTNFCGVDWRELANDGYYEASQVNVKTVGSQIALFIQMLNKHNVTMDSISIAGHSLGAQISGFVGNRIQELMGHKVSRIYGLDPAGPLFTTPIIKISDFRLSEKDAKFVQVLHTSCGTFGTCKISGHADFFANNGHIQKTCLPSTSIDELKDILTIFTCSHSLAIEIFRLSFTHKFSGVQYNNGLMSKLKNIFKQSESYVTDLFGIHSAESYGRFELTTTNSTPYCIDC